MNDGGELLTMRFVVLRRFDRLAKTNDNLAGTHSPVTLLLHGAAAYDRCRGDFQTRTQGKHECALLELLESPVCGARAFRKNHDRAVVGSHELRGLVERLDGLGAILPHDRDVPGRFPRVTENRNLAKLCLRDEAEALRENGRKREYVVPGLVIAWKTSKAVSISPTLLKSSNSWIPLALGSGNAKLPCCHFMNKFLAVTLSADSTHAATNELKQASLGVML